MFWAINQKKNKKRSNGLAIYFAGSIAAVQTGFLQWIARRLMALKRMRNKATKRDRHNE